MLLLVSSHILALPLSSLFPTYVVLHSFGFSHFGLCNGAKQVLDSGGVSHLATYYMVHFDI